MSPAMLELIVQSPTVLFAQWDFPFLCEQECMIRLYRLPDVGALPQYGSVCLELPLPQSAGSMYFYRLTPGHHYVVEIGIRREGVFYPLRRSNVATTPRTEAATEEPERVAAVVVPLAVADWFAEGSGAAPYYPGE